MKYWKTVQIMIKTLNLHPLNSLKVIMKQIVSALPLFNWQFNYLIFNIFCTIQVI